MAEHELGPGSEGDAYRYTKKALLALPNVERVKQIYTEVAANRNISSWTRACYQDIRAQFFRDGQCKIKFAPGVARIAFGELELGTGDEEFRKLADLRDFVRIISIAHFTEFTRHLVLNGEEMTFATLTAMYGSTAQDNWKDLKKELRSIKYGPRRYTIVWLDSFETAQQYAKYTYPHTWCHLNSKSAFESYSYAKKWTKSGKQMVSPVKLYLAYLPGYETMGLDDPLYGESMLGIDISPDGRLVHVNNRWNHAHDNIDERKGDNKYSERELSELLGAPFYKVCPPISKRDLNRIVSKANRAVKRRKAVIDQFARKAAAFITRKVTAPRSEGTMTDPVTGRTYKTVVEGGLEWMAEPLFRFDAPDIREPGNLAKAKEAVARWWEQRLKETDTTSKAAPDEEDFADPVPMIADGLDGILRDPMWEGTYCELHTYTEPATGKTIVYRECDVMGKETFDHCEVSLSARNTDYRKWRAEQVTDPVMPAGAISSDDCESAEISTPLSFDMEMTHAGRSSIGFNQGNVKITHTDTMGPVTLFKSTYVDNVLPEGWRLPTVCEFIAAKMRGGCKAAFRSSTFEFLTTLVNRPGSKKDYSKDIIMQLGDYSREDARELLQCGFANMAPPERLVPPRVEPEVPAGDPTLALEDEEVIADTDDGAVQPEDDPEELAVYMPKVTGAIKMPALQMGRKLEVPILLQMDEFIPVNELFNMYHRRDYDANPWDLVAVNGVVTDKQRILVRAACSNDDTLQFNAENRGFRDEVAIFAVRDLK